MRTIRVEILSAAISWYSTTIFRLRSSQVVQGYLRCTIASATAIRYRFGLRSSHCHAYDTVFFYFMQLRYSSPWTFLAYHCTYDISCDLHTIFSPTIVACHAAWQTLALSLINYSFTQITHLLTLTHTHTYVHRALSLSRCALHTPLISTKTRLHCALVSQSPSLVAVRRGREPTSAAAPNKKTLNKLNDKQIISIIAKITNCFYWCYRVVNIVCVE